MDWQHISAVADLATNAFGVCYCLFGTGPRIPNVPRWAIALLRLTAPLPALAVAYWQSAYADAAAS
jgi:hypothetical protein